jgi:hypothetical protein
LAEALDQPCSRTDPKAASHAKVALPRAEGQETGECTMARAQQGEALAAANPQPGWEIRKRHRDWMVIDPQGELVCITVYKRGAKEVVRRLSA